MLRINIWKPPLVFKQSIKTVRWRIWESQNE